MTINDWYLNVVELPVLSNESISYLKSLAPYKASYWELKTDNMLNYKKELLSQLLRIQNNRCVYCGVSVARRSCDREHFVHKAAKSGYQEFMFNSDNLFAACEYCNRRLKGQTDVIKKYNKKYSLCEFNIVHPYYDIPDDYIKFLPNKDNPARAVPTDTDNGKGQSTITMFDLDSLDMYRERLGYIASIKVDESQFASILTHKPM